MASITVKSTDATHPQNGASFGDLGETDLMEVGAGQHGEGGGIRMPMVSSKAIQSGAKGVDMGRNIFQSLNPIAMCQAVGKVVHENYTDKEAYEFFLDMSK